MAMAEDNITSGFLVPDRFPSSDFADEDIVPSQTTEEETGNPYILPWYIQVGYAIAFVAMVTVAVGGNTGVVWIVMAHRRMRTVTNYFLVNLAVADAMVTVFNTMFNFVFMLYSDWPFGKTYCKFTLFIAPCTIAASAFTFIAIAIDRYLAIVHPLKPRQGAYCILAIIVVIWIVSIGLSIPNLIYAETYTWYYPSSGGNETTTEVTSEVTATRTICYLDWPEDVNRRTADFAYNMFLMIVTYFLPLVILSVTYMVIGCQLWGSQAIGEHTEIQLAAINAKRRVVKMLIVVIVIFAVCWLPQNVLLLTASDNDDQSAYIQHIYLVFYWLAMSNSMYNPIIYCWMNSRFRDGFKRAFGCLLPCLPCGSHHRHSSLGGFDSTRGTLRAVVKGDLDQNGARVRTGRCNRQDGSDSVGGGLTATVWRKDQRLSSQSLGQNKARFVNGSGHNIRQDHERHVQTSLGAYTKTTCHVTIANRNDDSLSATLPPSAAATTAAIKTLGKRDGEVQV